MIINLLCSTSTTKLTKQLPQVYYIILFFFHEWAKNIIYYTFFFHERAKNIKTKQYGNWYQADIQKEKNRIKRRGRSCISRRKNKNKNREELGDCGFQGRKHGHGHDTDTITTQWHKQFLKKYNI